MQEIKKTHFEICYQWAKPELVNWMMQGLDREQKEGHQEAIRNAIVRLFSVGEILDSLCRRTPGHFGTRSWNIMNLPNDEPGNAIRRLAMDGGYEHVVLVLEPQQWTPIVGTFRVILCTNDERQQIEADIAHAAMSTREELDE